MRTPEVLLDINVFEDIFTSRQGVESSSQLLNLVRTGVIKGWVSSIVPVVLYFLRRKRGEDETSAREKVKAILKDFSLLPFRKVTFHSALESNCSGFLPPRHRGH